MRENRTYGLMREDWREPVFYSTSRRLVGEVGKALQLEFQFQSNTRRSRPVLSVISLALQLVRHGMAAFPPREFREALERLRYDHPALQL